MVVIRVEKKRVSHKKVMASTKVGSWHASNALRSKLSADERVRKLGLFCQRTQLTPEKILGLAKEKPEALASICVEYARTMQKRGNLDSGTAKVFDAVRAWIRFNGEVFERFPSLHVIQGASLRAERTPTQDELRRLLNVLSPRGRVAALMMAHAGLRPGSLCNVNAVDGLVLGDLPELSLASGFPFKAQPFQIMVPGRLSKTRVNYVTFGSSELAEALQTYLTERKALGETLSASSPVIAVLPSADNKPARVAALAKRERKDRSLFITSQALTKELRESILRVVPNGVRWRPYVLRAYCSTQLWTAGNHGKIDRDAREAILGHNLGVAGRYNLSKTLHPNLIEELREAYKRCEPFLSTIPTKGAQDTQANIAKVMLLGLGYTEEELADKDLLDPQVFQQMVKDKMVSAAPRQKQKLVEAQELPHYLEDGWTVVTAVNGHQVVLNPPGS